jgi:hypothetical protein
MAEPPGSVAGYPSPGSGYPGADPPYVPIRRSPWPTRPPWPSRRAPRWLLLAAVAFIAAAVLVALVHKPSRAERASDLRGFLTDMNTDIESCAGGVGESLDALHQIQSGASHSAADVADAISIANTGASNCSPANNEQIDDLDSYQVTESLASFHLGTVVTGLVNWAAPDAENVQTDVALVLAAQTPQAKDKATAQLRQALRRLDAQRSAVDAVMDTAIRSLSAGAKPPRLPG